MFLKVYLVILSAFLSLSAFAEAKKLTHSSNSTPKVCLMLAKESRPKAELCLQLSDREKRAKCFEKIGKRINAVAPNDICEISLEPIKQEFVQKEKKLYPNQDPALK